MLRSLLYISFGEHMYSFLLCLSLGVEVLDYSVCLCSALVVTTAQSFKRIFEIHITSLCGLPRETSECQSSLTEEAEERATQGHLSNGLSASNPRT